MAGYTPWSKLSPAEKERRQAERHAKTTEASERIQRAVQAMIDGDQFQAVLKMARTLRRYSLHNTLMIVSQRSDATQVAGFNQWKKLGRHVKQGAKSIKIWVPAKFKERDEAVRDVTEGVSPAPIAGGAGDGMVEAPLTGKSGGTRFMLGSVFDVSDTEGEPLPEFPKMEFSREDRPEYHEALRRLFDYARAKLDCSVTVETRETSARGSWSPTKRDLWVAADGSILERLAVTCHELVHGLAGHQNTRSSTDQYALQEVVADGSAFLVMDAFGFDTSAASTPYLAGYAKNPAMLIQGLTEARALAEAVIRDLEELWLPLFPEVAAAREQAALVEGVLTADQASNAGDPPDAGARPLPNVAASEARSHPVVRVGPELSAPAADVMGSRVGMVPQTPIAGLSA